MDNYSNNYARDFRELVVYRRQRELAREVFAVSKKFPREESRSLTDQIRRSSRSIGAQIAEAWAKRRYEKHFISKLTDADAEQRETQHCIETPPIANISRPNLPGGCSISASKSAACSAP